MSRKKIDYFYVPDLKASSPAVWSVKKNTDHPLKAGAWLRGADYFEGASMLADPVLCPLVCSLGWSDDNGVACLHGGSPFPPPLGEGVGGVVS